MEETIYDVYWEGPFIWEERNKHIMKGHVLYAIYGSHHMYGRDVLLYIGMSDGNMKNRLSEHEEWIEYEYDQIYVRFASIGIFTSWRELNGVERHRKASSTLTKKIEALLIHSCQPAYNSQNKADIHKATDIRVFNSGRLGHLLPEISYKYYADFPKGFPK